MQGHSKEKSSYIVSMSNTLLYQQLDSLPEHLRKQALDFIEFLKEKNGIKDKPQKKKKKLKDLKGALSKKEAEAMLKYVNDSRKEWDKEF